MRRLPSLSATALAVLALTMAAPRAGAQALYVADYGNGNVDVVPPGGGTPAVLSNAFFAPFGIAVDKAGNVYVADVSGTTVYQITPGGAVSPYATDIPNPIVVGGGGPTGLAFDSHGNLYISAFGAGEVDVVGPGGGAVSTFATGFYRPEGLAFDSQGNLYVANHGLPGGFFPAGTTVDEVTPGGVVSTFATGLDLPDGLAFDSNGNLYVANQGTGTVSMVGPGGGAATTFATGLSSPQGLAFDALGNLYVTDAGPAEVLMYGPGGGSSPVVYSSGYVSPEGLAFAPVPEPSSLVLCGLGAVGLAGYARHRRTPRA